MDQKPMIDSHCRLFKREEQRSWWSRSRYSMIIILLPSLDSDKHMASAPKFLVSLRVPRAQRNCSTTTLLPKSTVFKPDIPDLWTHQAISRTQNPSTSSSTQVWTSAGPRSSHLCSVNRVSVPSSSSPPRRRYHTRVSLPIFQLTM